MIKSVVKDKLIKENEYPILKISLTGSIVLFISENEGTVCNSLMGAHKLGYYSDSWDDSVFTKFNGEITLKNN